MSFSKKRKYPDIPTGEPKRIKPEPSSVNSSRPWAGSASVPFTPKRTAVAVLEELCNRVKKGDRQLAVMSMREFSTEHLASISSGSDSNVIVQLLLQAIVSSKQEQIVYKILELLTSVLNVCEDCTWRTSVLSLFSQGLHFFQMGSLAAPLMKLVTDALCRKVISANEMPPEVKLCADQNILIAGHPQARAAAIRMSVVRILSDSDVNPMAEKELEEMLCEMTADCDARVRVASINGLAELVNRGSSICQSSYKIVKDLTEDSSARVRVCALRILFDYSRQFPDREVESTYSASGEKKVSKILVCDDAFSTICHAVNDMQVAVRTEAATLLGKFDVVSDEFLDQTLDKKLLRTMKSYDGRSIVKEEKNSMFALTKSRMLPTRQGGYQSRWKSYSSGCRRREGGVNEWASGKDLNAPCPSQKAEDTSQSIIPQGACGAFVTALEDEFHAVRKAAVYSLGRLAAQRPGFATTALDHLTDMFNDEIAEVRLDAIHALTPLVIHGQLQKEQLAIILKCLDDAMMDSRQALRDLLVKAEFSDIQCMELAVTALLNCMHRFPSDQDMVIKCMSQLGAKHGVFVHSMVRRLLDLHKIYDSAEQQINDPHYTAKLVLILNAASEFEPLISMLPPYVIKHYRFMRTSAPDLVLPIKCIDDKFVGYSRLSAIENGANHCDDLLQMTYNRLCDAPLQASLTERNLLRQAIAEDTDAIARYIKEFAGAAHFIEILAALCATRDTMQRAVLSGEDFSSIHESIEREKLRILYAQQQFICVHPSMLYFLAEMSLQFSILDILNKLLQTRNDPMFSKEIIELTNSVRVCESRCAEIGCEPSPSLLLMLGELQELINCGEAKKAGMDGHLTDILMRYPPKLPSEFPEIDSVQMKWANITDPKKDVALEHTVVFVAGLPTCIPFSAILHNFMHEELCRIRIKVDYPDQTSVLHRPRPSDFSHTETDDRMLTTQVVVTSPLAWSESALIRLNVVLLATDAVATPVLDSPTSRKGASVLARIHPVLEPHLT